jgi:hypothetical protein
VTFPIGTDRKRMWAIKPFIIYHEDFDVPGKIVQRNEDKPMPEYFEKKYLKYKNKYLSMKNKILKYKF